MKIVKLNKRFIAYNFGFTHALRFGSWNQNASDIEQFLQNQYDRIYSNKHGPFYTKFGRLDKDTRSLTYWIYLRYEADITMVLLKSEVALVKI